ncbi:MAG: hypothetical protein WCJ58_00005 [bacterium]
MINSELNSEQIQIMLKWNSQVKLILADVDETITDVYTDAVPEMIVELEKLLREGKVLFLASGGGLESILDRVVLKINKSLRKQIIIAHCAGAEVYGLDDSGNLKKLYFSLYDQVMTAGQKTNWRKLTTALIERMQLKIFPAMAVKKFKTISHEDPLAIILSDRGPQITLEFINAYNLQLADLQKIPYEIPYVAGKYDLRHKALEIIQELLVIYSVPIDVKFGGEFALDMRLKGVSKEVAIRKVLADSKILKNLGLTTTDVNNPEMLEIWGDKFSLPHGSDFDMSLAVHSQVRSIDFRIEDPLTFEKGYNIQLWDGQKHLHEGLLEYLQSRK